MQSGHGRLILRDGTDLPIGYRLAYDGFGHWCSGTLIGNIRSVDPGSFSKNMVAQLDDNSEIVLLVIGYSDRHVSFVASFDAAPTVEHVNALALPQNALTLRNN